MTQLPIWKPSKAAFEAAALTRFAAAAGQDADYMALWRWSVGEPEAFWGALAEFLGVRWHTPPTRVLGSRAMPGAEWFPGSRLSFPEHVFAGRDPDAVAIRSVSEVAGQHVVQEWTWSRLRQETARIREGLQAFGVGVGDRVAAYMPNIPDTVAAFLATVSLGAIWSCAAPEFGVDSVVARFKQIEPTVLLAVDGYRYSGTVVERDIEGEAIAERINARYIRFGHLDGSGWRSGFLGSDSAELSFIDVAFDHPLWVLYSSGTTGLPKAIVHSHGGIVLGLLQTMVLQFDVRTDDRVFWFTTTGWVMWNVLVGGLLAGASIVLYDGRPTAEALWDLAEGTGTTLFGTSPAFLDSCRRSGFDPLAGRDLSALRAIGSTGSPLTVECSDWVYQTFPAETWLFSSSGGTDIAGAFLGAAPTFPTYRGELGPPVLGVDLRSYSRSGESLIGEVGELVVTQPIPSMPIAFWNDPDGSRLREAYFAQFPHVWTHGDWIQITERNTGIIYGRSDATINRGGVRMGSAEFYQALSSIDAIDDSLVVDLPTLGPTGLIVLFVSLREATLDSELRATILSVVRTACSPRHVPDEVVQVSDIPRTSSGKKLEIPIKRILMGADPHSVVSRTSLANPKAFDELVEFADRFRLIHREAVGHAGT